MAFGMRQLKPNSIWLVGFSGLALGILLSVSFQPIRLAVQHLVRSPFPAPVLTFAPLLSTAFTPAPTLRYETRSLPGSTIQILYVPAQSQFVVTVALSSELELLETLAQEADAIAALNGGFFDPENQQSTSYIFSQGNLAADPRQNERLTQNPDLAPYLTAIFDRSEFRQYRCGSATQYEIAPHYAPQLPGCDLIASLGAGPQLLPTLTLKPEGFLDEQNGVVIRDPLGSNQPNARSAIGITALGDLILVMAAQQPNKTDGAVDLGLSLNQLADLMRSLGATTALNLDGGSSAAFYYNGETVYGKVASDGTVIKRPIKSALVVKATQ
jgi:hypothetical protein